jgi:hypothetical protein
MSYFYGLRGWLEIDEDDFLSITSLLENLQSNHSITTKTGLYLQGWNWSNPIINWTKYIFYGADVTEEGLTLFEDTISKLLALNLNLDGYFEAEGEDKEVTIVYRIMDNILYKGKGTNNCPLFY